MPLDKYKDPVTYLFSLDRKITVDDLMEYVEYAKKALIRNPNPLQDIVNDFMENRNVFRLIMERNNKINDRIKRYMLGVTLHFKDKLYAIIDVDFEPFNTEMSLGSGAVVNCNIKIREVVQDDNGDLELTNIYFVKKRYRAVGPTIKTKNALFPAIFGSNQTGPMYENRYNGGYITSTTSSNNYPIPAKLKISIIVAEETVITILDKDNKNEYMSEFKFTTPEGTSKLTLKKITKSNQLMVWERLNVHYLVVKEYVFNQELAKSLKFNIFVFIGYILYLEDTDISDVDKYVLSYDKKYLYEAIDIYAEYRDYFSQTIKDAETHITDNKVYLVYPFLKYINLEDPSRLDNRNIDARPKNGSLKIEIGNDIPTLKNIYAKTPLDYIIRYLSPLQEFTDISISQIKNNTLQMMDMYLSKMFNIVYDSRMSTDRDHWLNRRLETIDDKIVKMFQQELNRSIREIMNEKRNSTIKEAFNILTSEMKNNISSISKSRITQRTQGSSKEKGEYIDKNITNRNSVGTNSVEIVVESDPDKTTSLKLRILHPSAHPFVDSGHTKSDTTLGGLIRHLSCFTRVTESSDIKQEIAKIRSLLKPGDEKVYINNILIGSFYKPEYKLVLAKRIAYINPDISIFTRNGMLHANMFNGIPSRPCVDHKLLLSASKKMFRKNKVDYSTTSKIWLYIRNTVEGILGLPKSKSIKDYALCGAFEYINTFDQNIRLDEKTIWTSLNHLRSSIDRDDFDEIDSGYCEIGPEVFNSTNTLSLPYFNYIEATRANYFATQDKHKLELEINAPPIAPDNYYATYSTVPFIRGIGLRAYGEPNVGFLAVVSSGSYHGQEQEDHYTLNKKSLYKIGYTHIKNYSIEYTKRYKMNSNLGYADDSIYRKTKNVEYADWLEKNNITEEDYVFGNPIHIKPGVELEYNKILVVLFAKNEKKIGSMSKKFYGSHGYVRSIKMEGKKKRNVDKGYIRVSIEESYEGHPGQKLTTNHAQKATVSEPADNLKIYKFGDKYIECDISMSMENVISRRTPGLIIEGYITPILVHLGVSIEIPAYAKLLKIKDLVKYFGWWKKVETYIPENNDSDRPVYILTSHKEYPMMLHFYVLSQDGATKGSVADLTSRVDETSGGSKKGGEHGGLQLARMETMGLVATNKHGRLLKSVYFDKNATSVRYVPVCLSCNSIGYIKRIQGSYSILAICNNCGTKETIHQNKTSKKFNSVKYRTHVGNTDKLMEMLGIHKKIYF